MWVYVQNFSNHMSLTNNYIMNYNSLMTIYIYIYIHTYIVLHSYINIDIIYRLYTKIMDNLLYSIRDMRSKNGPPFVAPGFYRDGHFVAIRDTSFLPSLLAPNSQNLELCTLVDETNL